jgi:hypothetical protein
MITYCFKTEIGDPAQELYKINYNLELAQDRLKLIVPAP